MTIRRIALQAATSNLTAGKSITVDANGLLIDGVVPYSSGGTDVPIADGGTGSSTSAAARLALGLVDANDRMPTAMLPTKILNSYWHASWDEVTVVAGTWDCSGYANQTDFDSSIFATPGWFRNVTTHANNDEVHFGSISLNAGTYKIIISCMRNTDFGIIEILLGTTSLGTFDAFGTAQYNTVASFTYSPTIRVSGNLRVKVTGKNGSSSNYYMYISRLEIIRTG